MTTTDYTYIYAHTLPQDQAATLVGRVVAGVRGEDGVYRKKHGGRGWMHARRPRSIPVSTEAGWNVPNPTPETLINTTPSTTPLLPSAITGIVAGAKSTVDATLNYGARLRVRLTRTPTD